MQNIISEMIHYIQKGKKTIRYILLYEGIILILSLIFLSDNPDLPLDILLLPIISMILPCIMLYLMIKDDVKLLSKTNIIIQVISPLVFINILLYLYALIRTFYGGYFEIIAIMFILGLPLELFIVTYLIQKEKINVPKVIFTVFLVAVYFASYILAEYLGNMYKTGTYMYIYIALFLYAIPLTLFSISLYKK